MGERRWRIAAGAPLTAHAHDWRPVPGLMAQYACGCGASGFRWLLDGVIRAHRQPKRLSATPTMRTGTGGRKPGLDDYDREVD